MAGERTEGPPTRTVRSSAVGGSLVVVRVQPSTRRARRGLGSRLPIDEIALARAMPEIGQALAARKLVEIVGPAEVLDGIRHGIYSFTEADTGFTSVVRASDGKIVGHARLEWAGGAFERAVAVAVWEVASAVTLQHYLHRIDRTLAEVHAEVRALRNDAAWAELERAACEVPVFAAQLQSAGRFDVNGRQRLDAEERALDIKIRQELRGVRRAADLSKALTHEIDTRFERDEKRGALKHTAASVAATLPGGLRARILDTARELTDALRVWEFVCYAHQVHAALVALQLADDALRGLADQTDRLQRQSLVDAAAEQRRLAADLGAVSALDATNLGRLYILDSKVADVLGVLASAHAGLDLVAHETADRLHVASTARIESLILERHRGRLVARNSLVRRFGLTLAT
jgi:hypothetical protein